MKKRHLISVALLVGVQLMSVSGFAAETIKPATMDQLLDEIRRGAKSDSLEQQKREREFLADKQEQKKLVVKAEWVKSNEEARSARLEKGFADNERAIAELEQSLHLAMGNMGELFGVIRQVAGDTTSQLETSLVSAQYADRANKLAPLIKDKSIPSVDQLEDLWFLMQQEMTESGKVTQFSTAVTSPTGEEKEQLVTRVGVFNAVSEGSYLRWVPEVGKLTELSRQPSARYLNTVEDLESSSEGIVRFAIDPSRGSILSLLVQTPSVKERLQFGGLIGYLILALGALAMLGALMRIVYLLRVNHGVQGQRKTSVISTKNPLGRVMKVREENPDLNTEALSLKLDEAIVREQSKFEQFLWAIKVVSVVAPLMGLLGTVTGMIRTFQAITLFGTGDPKLMAGGISEALVTTMLGLVVAIPLVLLHSWLRTMSRRLTEILGEQSTGMVARAAEKEANAL